MTTDDDAAARPAFAWIWDVPVRLFHWLLVALLGFSWWSGERHEMEWHRLSGYCILGLLVFRIYWGFAGGRTARFAQFVRGPRAALDYVRGGHSGIGHNPIGGWSVVALLAMLTTMVVAGLFAVDVDGLESGPLADYVTFEQGRFAEGVHGWVFDVLLVLTALHVAAILFYLLGLRRNLIWPMVTGRARAVDGAPPAPLGASPWKAVVGVAVAAVFAYAVSRGLRF